MLRRTVTGLALWAAMALQASAQEGQVWIKLEELPTLARAQLSAEGYSAQLTDVEGFYLGSGWYAVALGPYSPEEAQAILDRYVADGLLPGEAAITDGSEFQNRFWPVAAAGAGVGTPAPEDAGAEAAAGSTGTEPAAQAAPAPVEPEIPEETLAEAQASEAALSRGQREQLQTALQWAGVYSGGIDGAFGPGTRTAMATWQSRKGYEATGVLTARQRAELLGEYNAVLNGLGLQMVRNEAAGIEVELPLAVLAPPVTDPPFVRYDGLEDDRMQVLLISQPGDPSRLAGLYEIMQTLEIVPPTGERQRVEGAFAIEGQDERIHSTTYAWLVEGQIKGFTLVWPVGDEERRSRLLETMRASFRRLPGVLDPAAGDPGEDQAVDLVSGLQIRQPQGTATGFFVDAAGTVVTTAEAVAGCAEITLDETAPARVATVDEELNLAVLRPEAPLAPRAVAAFRPTAPRIGAEVAVAGYPYGGALARPALTFGTMTDVRGLGGEEEVRRLELAAQVGDAGGPVLDGTGAVIGMLLPRETNGQVLPEDVTYALDAETIRAALERAGVAPTLAEGATTVPAEKLTRDAEGLAVLVSCW